MAPLTIGGAVDVSVLGEVVVVGVTGNVVGVVGGAVGGVVIVVVVVVVGTTLSVLTAVAVCRFVLSPTPS